MKTLLVGKSDTKAELRNKGFTQLRCSEKE